MFSGNEWLVLVLLVLPFVLLAVVIADRQAKEGRRRGIAASLNGRQVNRPPAEVRQAVQLGLAGEKNLTVLPSGTDTLLLERQFFPTWTVVVAVVFFPLGLLALLAKRSETATVIVNTGMEGGSEVLVAGPLSKRTALTLNTLLR